MVKPKGIKLSDYNPEYINGPYSTIMTIGFSFPEYSENIYFDMYHFNDECKRLGIDEDMHNLIMKLYDNRKTSIITECRRDYLNYEDSSFIKYIRESIFDKIKSTITDYHIYPDIEMDDKKISYYQHNNDVVIFNNIEEIIYYIACNLIEKYLEIQAKIKKEREEKTGIDRIRRIRFKSDL